MMCSLQFTFHPFIILNSFPVNCYTLDRSPVKHRADTENQTTIPPHTHIYTYVQASLESSLNLAAWLWIVVRNQSTWKKLRHRESMQPPYRKVLSQQIQIQVLLVLWPHSKAPS